MGGAVVDEALALGVAADGEFAGERDLGAPRAIFGEELADAGLADAEAIDICGVEEIDAEVDGGREQAQRLRLAAWPVEAGKAHAAEADGMNGGLAEGARDHGGLAEGGEALRSYRFAAPAARAVRPLAGLTRFASPTSMRAKPPSPMKPESLPRSDGLIFR